MIKAIQTLCLALSMVLFLSAPGRCEATTEIARENSLILCGVQKTPPIGLSPFIAGGNAYPIHRSECNLIYEALYLPDAQGKPGAPLLADGQPLWEDGYQLKVKIKPQARWQDGEALDADDVFYSFLIANSMQLPWSDACSSIERIERIDAHSIRFTLRRAPYDQDALMRALCRVKILPEHIWRPLIEAGSTQNPDIPTPAAYENPVGSGPFKLLFWDDARIITQRDDQYWGSCPEMYGKLTEVGFITFLICADDAACDQALADGSADVRKSEAGLATSTKYWVNYMGRTASEPASEAPNLGDPSAPLLVEGAAMAELYTIARAPNGTD